MTSSKCDAWRSACHLVDLDAPLQHKDVAVERMLAADLRLERKGRDLTVWAAIRLRSLLNVPLVPWRTRCSLHLRKERHLAST